MSTSGAEPAQWVSAAGYAHADDSLAATPPSEPSGDGPDVLTWVLIGLFVAAYAGFYAFLVRKFGPDTVQRKVTHKYMCCWLDLYSGKAWWVYNVLFCPIILAIHAVRIYLGSCLHVYIRRAFWLTFGCLTPYFTDKYFPPNPTSLGEVGGDSANVEAGRSGASVEWVRAMDFPKPDVRERAPHPHLHNTDMCLFQGKVEAKDILQGALGDCWLLAAMACLSEQEGAISRLFITPEVDPRGMYRIRLYDPQHSRWRTIVVDDFVPCERDPSQPDGVRRGEDGVPVTHYAKPHGKEIWAMMLEKAFAKFCGNYASIEAGITEWGIVCMTGGNAWRYEAAGPDSWTRSDLVIHEDLKDKRACGFRTHEEHHDAEELFELLRFYHRHGAVLCCGGVRAEGQAQGLVQKHAFSLLQVRSVRKHWESDQYFRFVQVRNPWGTGEWTGPWSDNSPEWTEYPFVKQELGFENGDDGAYWMQWEDFCDYWSYVGVVDCTSDIHSMRPPLYLESEPTGPLKSFFKGCGHYWCLLGGLSRLFVQHQASSEKIPRKQFRRMCGIDPTGLYCRICEQEPIRVEGRGKKPRHEPHEMRYERGPAGGADGVALLGGA